MHPECVGHIATHHHVALARPVTGHVPVAVQRLHGLGIDAGQRIRCGVDAHAFVTIGGGFRAVFGRYERGHVGDGGRADTFGFRGRIGRGDDEVRAICAHLLVHLLRYGNAHGSQAEQRGRTYQRCDHGHHRTRTATEHRAPQHGEEHLAIGHFMFPTISGHGAPPQASGSESNESTRTRR